VSKIEQSGRSSLRRPKLPIKGGSAPEEEEGRKIMGRTPLVAYRNGDLVRFCNLDTVK